MIKHYIDQHDVEYLGTYDGEGTMSGHWKLAGFSGRWMIWITRLEKDALTEEIREYIPI